MEGKQDARLKELFVELSLVSIILDKLTARILAVSEDPDLALKEFFESLTVTLSEYSAADFGNPGFDEEFVSLSRCMMAHMERTRVELERLIDREPRH